MLRLKILSATVLVGAVLAIPATAFASTSQANQIKTLKVELARESHAINLRNATIATDNHTIAVRNRTIAARNATISKLTDEVNLNVTNAISLMTPAQLWPIVAEIYNIFPVTEPFCGLVYGQDGSNFNTDGTFWDQTYSFDATQWSTSC